MRHTTLRAAVTAAALLLAGGAHAQFYGNQTYPTSLTGNLTAGAVANPLNSWNGASIAGQGGYGYNPNALQTNQYGVGTGYGNTGTNYVQGTPQQVLAPKVSAPNVDDVMSVGRTGNFQNGSGSSSAQSAKADVKGERMEGTAQVVDGKTLLIGSNLIVLNGADAPSADQTCTDSRGMPWECGRRAKDRLNQLVAGQHVVCVGTEQARSGVAAKCKVGMTDLGKTMVEDGYAMSPKAVAPAYASNQVEAENGHRGMWLGTFKDPWDVRAGK